MPKVLMVDDEPDIVYRYFSPGEWPIMLTS
jgi:hypothetical protein